VSYLFTQKEAHTSRSKEVCLERIFQYIYPEERRFICQSRIYCLLMAELFLRYLRNQTRTYKQCFTAVQFRKHNAIHNFRSIKKRIIFPGN